MISRLLTFLSLAFLLTQFAFSQVEKSNVDFTADPTNILRGEIEISYEWLQPKDFLKRDLKVIDIVKASALSPESNQIVASKLVFISQKKIEELAYEEMNKADYISKMLNSSAITQRSADSWNVTNKVKAYGLHSSAITQRSADSWNVTNKVKAYGLPFKVNFDFKFREVGANVLPHQVVKYLQSEASAFPGTGKETFLTLDMTNFSQLIYRNYSLVYLKELSNGTTLVVSGVVAAIDIKKANAYFNYPPISRTESTMMGNMRRQILHMAKEIQN